LRLGEKLHEDLFGDGEVGVRSEHPKIFHVQVPAVDGSALDELVSIDGDLVAYTMLAMIRRLMVVEAVALEAPQGSGRLTLETS
jgi:FlaA1/EpsC-like NDP-sugar epimerase